MYGFCAEHRGQVSGDVQIGSPITGQYKVQVIGGVSGSKFLDSYTFYDAYGHSSKDVTGTIQTCNVLTYIHSYDATQPGNIAMTYQGAATSTQGLISPSSKAVPACARGPFSVGQTPCAY